MVGASNPREVQDRPEREAVDWAGVVGCDVHVEYELLEQPPVEHRPDRVTPAALAGLCPDPAAGSDLELESVAEIQVRGVIERIVEQGDVVTPGGVGVLRRPARLDRGEPARPVRP